MAAARKVTLADEAEIVRRRREGEQVRPLAAEFGVAHQTIAKIMRRAAAREAAEPARVPVDPPETACTQERAATRDRLPDDAEAVIAAGRYYRRRFEPERRRRPIGGGRILRSRGGYDDWRARRELERLDPSFAMRLRDESGVEIGYAVVGCAEALELQARGSEHLIPSPS